MNELITKLGSLDLDKGDIRDGHKLIIWDAVQDCIQKACPIYSKCDYPKKDKCTVQVRYIETLILTVKNTYKYLDDVQLAKVGLHLIPLYSHLVRLKIIEMSIPTNEIIQVTKKGKYAHPVFKEIRQTLHEINMMWKDITIAPLNAQPPDPTDVEKEIVGDDPRLVDGDPLYYKRMAAQGTLRKKVIR